MLFGSLFWNACDQDNVGAKLSVDLVSFLKSEYNLNVTEDLAYIDIPVYHKHPLKNNSKLKIEVVPGEGTGSDVYTVETTEFDFSSSDTVMVRLGLNYANLQECINYSVKLKIVEEGYTKVSPYDGEGEVDINFVKFLPFVADDFVGTYSFNSEIFGDTWDVEIQKVDETTLKAVAVYDNFDILINMDDSDPSNFIASVETQEAWVHGAYGQAWVVGEGTFSVCEKKISLSLTHFVEAGSFGTFTEVFTMK